jgi:hypothetical protein
MPESAHEACLAHELVDFNTRSLRDGIRRFANTKPK